MRRVAILAIFALITIMGMASSASAEEVASDGDVPADCGAYAEKAPEVIEACGSGHKPDDLVEADEFGICPVEGMIAEAPGGLCWWPEEQAPSSPEIPVGQDTWGVGYIIADGDGAYCRVGPGFDYDVVDTISDGAAVEWQDMLGSSSDWVYVNWGDGCFVSKSLIVNEYLTVEPPTDDTDAVEAETTPVYPEDIDPKGHYPLIGSAAVANTNGDGAVCRIGAEQITVLQDGEVVQELEDGIGDGWQLVDIPDGDYCFIWHEYLDSVEEVIPKDSDYYESGTDTGSTDQPVVKLPNTGSGPLSGHVDYLLFQATAELESQDGPSIAEQNEALREKLWPAVVIVGSCLAAGLWKKRPLSS